MILLHVEVQFSLAHQFDLGSASYAATYARTAGQQKLSIKEVRNASGGPSISNREFELLANIDTEQSPATERMLVYTLPRLKEIATGSNADGRNWLRSVLDNCKNTPEKRLLESLLSRHK